MTYSDTLLSQRLYGRIADAIKDAIGCENIWWSSAMRARRSGAEKDATAFGELMSRTLADATKQTLEGKIGLSPPTDTQLAALAVRAAREAILVELRAELERLRETLREEADYLGIPIRDRERPEA